VTPNLGAAVMFLSDVVPATHVCHDAVAQIVNVNNLGVKGLQPSCDIDFAPELPLLLVCFIRFYPTRGRSPV
jgi:hypothetical protein